MWDAIAALAGLLAVAVALAGLMRELASTRKDREQAQVSRVSSYIEDAPGRGRALVIRNDSDAPIFGVRSSELALDPLVDLAAFVPPGEMHRIEDFLPAVPGHEGRLSFPIVFIDAAGVHWTWWGAEGVPADPSNKDFDGRIFERRG